MSIWVTSDCHYGHEKLAFYRGFESVEAMDEKLIENHNARVRPNHSVYILGDLIFYKDENLARVINRLNGRKFLIFGNHDYAIRKSYEMQKLFVKCLDYYELTAQGHKLCMSHYPMMVWNRHHYGSIMLHGHCHGSMQYPFKGRIMDVGADVHGFAPIHIEDIINQMMQIDPHVIDNHVHGKKNGLETKTQAE